MSSCANLSPAPPSRNLATPEGGGKSRSEAQAQQAQCTLQVEEQIPKEKGIVDGNKPHEHRTTSVSRTYR